MTRFTGSALACRRSERIVFSDLDFAIAEGGALLLVGPNGSGKSSLLRLMAGLIRPYAGKLEWDGGAVSEDPAAHRRNVAYLGHAEALKPTLTAREIVGFWAGLRGHADQAGPALAALGLAEQADLPSRFLSAGQRRRAAIARILAAPPPLWLMDEPTVGLDRAAVKALEKALAAHRGRGGMVVAATHLPIDLPGAAELDLSQFAVETVMA